VEVFEFEDLTYELDFYRNLTYDAALKESIHFL